MGLIQNVEQKIEMWALKKALPHALKAGGAFVIGYLTSTNVIPTLAALGITIDTHMIEAKIAALGSGAALATVSHVVIDWVTHHLSKKSNVVESPKPPQP